LRRTVRSPLFPYTTLFRSERQRNDGHEWKEVLRQKKSQGRERLHPLRGERGFCSCDPICRQGAMGTVKRLIRFGPQCGPSWLWRSEEHTSELQSRENLVCR